MANFCIRNAKKEDCKDILQMVQELADFEKQPHGHGPSISVQELIDHGFGSEPWFEAIVAEDNTTQQLLGYAVFFNIYSTIDGKGLFLEDLYVKPNGRKGGVGLALMNQVVKIAAEKGCNRMDFHVLHWNESSIGFYEKKFGAFNVTEKTGFQIYRLNKESIHKCSNNV